MTRKVAVPISISLPILAMCLLLSISSKSSSPYRNVVYGMNYDEVKNVEIQNGGRKLEETEDGMLYETIIEGHRVRIRYNFENDALTSFSITNVRFNIDGLSDPSGYGDGNPEAFFSDFMKTLDKLYGTHDQKDSVYSWVNDYEVINGTIEEINLIYSTLAEFEFVLTKL